MQAKKKHGKVLDLPYGKYKEKIIFEILKFFFQKNYSSIDI